MSIRDIFDKAERSITETLGEPVAYSPVAGGGPFALEGVFRERTEIIRDHPGTPGLRPTVFIRLEDLPVDPEQNDTMVINGKTYSLDWVDPDGEGGATLILMEPQ